LVNGFTEYSVRLFQASAKKMVELTTGLLLANRGVRFNFDFYTTILITNIRLVLSNKYK